MYAYAAIPLICWLCALIAIPRKPRFGNEVEELVYVRLLGRQHRVILLALIVTVVAFVAMVMALPHTMQPNRSAVTNTYAICADADAQSSRPPCFTRRPGGTWEPDASVSVPAWDPRLVIDPRSGND
jgi:hypothetical protein